MIDVVSRKCQMGGCQKRPWFSYDGVRPTFCAEHKAPGMMGYRPAQKDANDVGEMGVIGGQKRVYADMSLHHHELEPPHGMAENTPPPDLVSTGLESVTLEGIDIGEDGLQEGGLGLDAIGNEDHLGQPRIDVPGLGGVEGLDTVGIGGEGLGPAGMSSADHLEHGALEQRGLDTPGLDTVNEQEHQHGGHVSHHPHEDAGMVLQHVTHPDSMRPGEHFGAAGLGC